MVWRSTSGFTPMAFGFISNDSTRPVWWSACRSEEEGDAPATVGRLRPTPGPPASLPPLTPTSLSGWRARYPPAPARLREVERTGRVIGRELAPEKSGDPAEGLRQSLAALGFQPSMKIKADGKLSCRLGNCPYRDSVRENADVVCTLHRGITAGVLEQLDPEAELTRFDPKDPDRAGCMIEVSR